MDIILNGQKSDVPDDISLASLVKKTSGHPEHVIAEINGHIVVHEQWNAVTLRANDTIELLTFVGGG